MLKFKSYERMTHRELVIRIQTQDRIIDSLTRELERKTPKPVKTRKRKPKALSTSLP